MNLRQRGNGLVAVCGYRIPVVHRFTTKEFLVRSALRTGGLATIAALFIAVPATAAVPTGTYVGKLSTGAKISFKVSHKGKRAGNFTVRGKLP